MNSKDSQDDRTGNLRTGCRAECAVADSGAGHQSTISSMAPLDQYLMERNAETALARSAAPESISRADEVMVLGRHGYETAVTGKNGFVCVVERSWMAPFDHPEFWNPKMRGPLCFNPPAVRSILPLPFKRSELVLAGLSKAQIIDAIKIFVKKELPPLEPGGMTYMMSSQASLGDDVGHWAPHLIVLSSPDRRYDLGCRRAWLSRFAESTISWRSRADQRVHDSGVQMVGRNGTDRYSLTARFRYSRGRLSSGLPTFYQEVLADLIGIGEGHFAHHLRRMRILYGERRSMVDSISGELEVLGGEAGMHLTVALPDGSRDVKIAERATGQNLWPLSRSYMGEMSRPGFILGFGEVRKASRGARASFLSRRWTCRTACLLEKGNRNRCRSA
jgi:hypothetical protein